MKTLGVLLLAAWALPLLAGAGGDDPDDEASADSLPPMAIRRGKLGEKGSIDHLLSIVFSPDGTVLALGAGEEEVCLQETDSGKPRAVLQGRPSRAVAFSRDGTRVAAVGEKGAIRLWDAATGREVFSIEPYADEGALTSLAFTLDGKALLSISDEGSIRLWDAGTGKPITRIMSDDSSWGTYVAIISPDAKVLASASEGEPVIRLWEAATGKCLAALKGHDEAVSCLAFSRDGRTLLSSGQDGSIRLWDAESGAQFLRLKASDSGNGANAVTLSPDDKLIASGHDDHTLRLWETASGKELLRLPGHGSEITAVAFSPDGKRLVSGDSDGHFLVWDMDRILGGGKPSDPERLWKDLAGPAPLQPLRDLAAMPEQAVALIRDHLKPMTAVPEQTAGLIAKLDDDDFGVREAATKSLEDMGAAVEPALRKALEGSPSAEARERLERLVAGLDSPVLSSPEDLRCSRAVFLLERIGSPPARDLLTKLASGLEGARLTRDAKGALERLGPTPALKPAEAPARP